MSRESKIGLFVLIGLAVMTYFVYRTSDLKKWFSGEAGNEREVGIQLDDASGMRQGTNVEIAGVKIGDVLRIELDGNKAIAVIRIPETMVFREGARAEVRSKGVLGERYIAVNLGHGEPLDDQAKMIGTAPPDLGAITATINELAQNLVDITESLKSSTIDGQGQNRVAQIAANMQQMSDLLVEIIKENRVGITTSTTNIATLTENLNRDIPALVNELAAFSRSLREMAEGNRGNIDETVTRVTELAKNFEDASASLVSIADKVDSGQGSIGKLVNDPATVDKVNEVLDNVNASVSEVKNLLGRANAIEMDLIARSEWFSEFETTKTYFGLKIQPNEDKYYLLEGVSIGDELTLAQTHTVTEETYDADGNLLTTTVRTNIEKPDDFLFNGQLAYRVGPVFLRGGIIESEGGGGIDYYTAGGRLKFSVEAFDFSRDDLSPHGRLDFKYNMTDNLHLNLGWDEWLESSREGAVFGAGIRWRDEDLKILFTQLGKFL